MAEDRIRYDTLAQEALRGVLRDVLGQAAKSGLPGEHHFYIAFDTQAEGVSLSSRLREQYPEEMTIVLQYQFWDLLVDEERFEVKLSFNNLPERLVVPFAAIRAFFDPSVQFGLQFGNHGPANDSAREDGSVPAIVKAEKPLPGEQDRTAVGAPAPASNASDASDAPDEPHPAGGDQPAAEVVDLETFRKK